MTFKVGDIITCVNVRCRTPGLHGSMSLIKLGESYKVRRVDVDEEKSELIKIIKLSGEPIPGYYYSDRFEMATEPYTATQVGDKEDDI